MRRWLHYPNLLVGLLICIPLTVGAFLAFPLFDDGWLVLILRESGPKVVASTLLDRPIYGHLMQALASLGPNRTFIYVLLNTLTWAAFGVQSGILFKRLFPELKEYAMLVAALTIAPIVVETQLCTIDAIIPANFSAMLSYGALLLLLRMIRAEGHTSPALWFAASALAAMSGLLSEYGVAANGAAGVLLLGMALTATESVRCRRLLASVGCLAVVTLAAYLLFIKTADLSLRPDVEPVYILGKKLGKWMGLPFNLIAGVWYSVVAAYARELSMITVEWESKSTIIGVFYGTLMAGALWKTAETRSAHPAAEGQSTRPIILVLAMLVGLLPVALMGRATSLLDFGSRFRIPILPIAVALTVFLAMKIVSPRMRWIPVIVLSFVAGYAIWMSAYRATEEHRMIATIGPVLKPYVAQTEGYTVAVTPLPKFEVEMTAIASSGWPRGLGERLWIYDADVARTKFGTRGACRPAPVIDEHKRSVGRTGPVSQLLWVEMNPGKRPSVEPYCLAGAEANQDTSNGRQ